MNDRYFLDTNLFIYTFDDTDRRKRRIARDCVSTALRDGLGMISFQVIQEFSSVALRKFAAPFSTVELREYIGAVLAPLCEIHSSIGLCEMCLNIREQSRYSFYDSLIIAAATEGGCRTLFTEDLQHGHVIAGVKIMNPFLEEEAR